MSNNTPTPRRSLDLTPINERLTTDAMPGDSYVPELADPGSPDVDVADALRLSLPRRVGKAAIKGEGTLYWSENAALEVATPGSRPPAPAPHAGNVVVPAGSGAHHSPRHLRRGGKHRAPAQRRTPQGATRTSVARPQFA